MGGGFKKIWAQIVFVFHSEIEHEHNNLSLFVTAYTQPSAMILSDEFLTRI